MKILNLGGAGFIGAHLTERLLSQGHTVLSVDIHTDKIQEFIDHKNLIHINQDITDPHYDLDGLVSDADLVIDLIAYANPGMYVRNPIDVFRLNFTENMKIAEACILHAKRLIQFSSCEVYGKTVASTFADQLVDPEDPSLATFSEDTTDFILGPVTKHRWIYSCAKQLLERVLHAHGLEGALDYTIIRPFNFLGPKIDCLPSETDGIPRVFSYFMEALLNGTAMKLVNGGASRRCYTYIDDAINCIYRIVENPGNVCSRQVFNVGTPMNEVTIRELAEVMREIYLERFGHRDMPTSDIVDVSGEEFYGEGYEDSDRRIPDNTKARELLGWDAKYGLREMLELTMAYYVTEYPGRVGSEQEWKGALAS